MLKSFKQNKAQAVMGEYVLVFFLVMAVITAMTVYIKRGIQARIFDARNTMFNIVVNRTQGYYSGGDNIYFEYEPYYGNTVSTIARRENAATELLPGATTGIFRKTFDDVTAVETRSETAPPRDAQ